MHNQPILKKLKIIKKQDRYPVSEHLEKSGIYIPSGPNISKKEIKFIASKINQFCASIDNK